MVTVKDRGVDNDSLELRTPRDSDRNRMTRCAINPTVQSIRTNTRRPAEAANVPFCWLVYNKALALQKSATSRATATATQDCARCSPGCATKRKQPGWPMCRFLLCNQRSRTRSEPIAIIASPSGWTFRASGRGQLNYILMACGAESFP